MKTGAALSRTDANPAVVQSMLRFSIVIWIAKNTPSRTRGRVSPGSGARRTLPWRAQAHSTGHPSSARQNAFQAGGNVLRATLMPTMFRPHMADSSSAVAIAAAPGF